LVFVITVTAIKQAWEDYRRHVADDKVNNAPAVVIRQGQEQRVKASDIVVGDIVKVIEDETIPCDMVLLSSSSEDGTCHVTTANLDGETNLKRLESPSWDNTTALNLATPMGLNNMESFIECEKPQVDLYKFVGRITIMVNGIKKVCPLNAVNLLVSGSTLKETNHAYACAVYTGHQTKMAQNLSLKSNKFSTAERTMNKLILVVIGYLFLEILVCSIFHFTIDEYPEQREMNLEDARHPTDFLLFMTIFNYVVPVALYVSIEMQKLIGSQFFSSDQDMYDEENDTWPVCNTSDISEELGQINYLFSDKTGTLTENTMEFRQCSAAGKRWLLEKGKLQSVNGDDTGSSLPDEVERLLLNMVLNHTVQVAGSDKPIYKASSPDEKAFLEAAAEVGMIYKGVNPRKEAEIEYKKEILKFSVLQILDFDPTRKCMSVIVKDLKSGEIFVMCKGAESSLDSKIISGSKEKAFEHLENFAGEGLRTLVFGERKLTQEEYNEYNELITKAQNALIEREQNLSAVYSQIEKDLSCVGATGVEDMLQEGVRDTLVSLNKAGIHVWVLTGDKKSTAINISYSCGHFNLDMERHELSDITTALELGIKFEELNQKINSEKEHALVLDGKTLSLIWEHNMKEELSKLSEKCSTVLCCRMSPLHKAQIVAMVKQFKDQPICAAIGDGANDVSMIQEAHVGIGIMGKEGRQAVRCSDFAFSKFHYLKKAILVHGHWYYYRISIFVMYQVYKNLTFCSPQLYYAQQNLFSSATLFESLYMQGIVGRNLEILGLD
jgi:phospholipid-translocating ATPase